MHNATSKPRSRALACESSCVLEINEQQAMKDIFSYPFDIPIFATQKFDLGGTPLLVVGGGGGDSKTGVKNKLVWFLPSSRLIIRLSLSWLASLALVVTLSTLADLLLLASPTPYATEFRNFCLYFLSCLLIPRATCLPSCWTTTAPSSKFRKILRACASMASRIFRINSALSYL